MTAAAGIPGVPTAALDAISDENTRMVLRAIVDGWQVRNGNTGKGDNRFVTAGELGSVTGARMIGGLTQTLTQEIGKQRLTPGEIGRVIADLQASVMESALWKSLGERVTLIDQDLIAGLAAEAIARQAAITNESTIRQTADTSLANQITTVTASVNTNAAAIQTEQTARVNGDNALATQITTQIASVNGNISALQSAQTTTANNVASLTSSVTTLQSSVAGNTAAIQQESITRANTDGLLLGQYTVKIDLNGHVSGFGLASTAVNSVPFSEFIVRADRFAIGAPSVVAGAVPFIVTTTLQTVNGRTVPPGVYMEDAFIKNGSITSAKIGLAEIDTLVIQGNAVTQPEMVFADGFQAVNVMDLGAGDPGPTPPVGLSYTAVAAISVNMGSYSSGIMAVMLMITYVPVNTSGGSWYTAYKLVESTGTVHFSGVGGVANNASSVALTSFGRAVVGQGVRTFTLYVGHYGDIRASGAGVREVRMMALGAKR